MTTALKTEKTASTVTVMPEERAFSCRAFRCDHKLYDDRDEYSNDIDLVLRRKGLYSDCLRQLSERKRVTGESASESLHN